MYAMFVVVDPEPFQLALQVQAVPEGYMIKILSSDRADQPLHERMRHRYIRNRLDLPDFEDAQVGRPTVEPKKGIVVCAIQIEVFPFRYPITSATEYSGGITGINTTWYLHSHVAWFKRL